MTSRIISFSDIVLSSVNAVGMGLSSYLSFEQTSYAPNPEFYRNIGYACTSVALLWGVRSGLSIFEFYSHSRNFLEKRLLKENEAITPITVDDYALFHQFGNGYKNTLTYNAQAVNGRNPKGRSNNRLGLKYYDGNNLLTIGYFQRNGTGHFHLIPCEASLGKITDLAALLYQTSKSPVYIKKISQEQRDALLPNPDFVAVDARNGWYETAPLEDDTYPERIIDLETTLGLLNLDCDVRRKHRRARREYSGRLGIEDYDPEKHSQDVLDIVKGFFGIQEERDMHFSLPEDYFNIINVKPVGVDYFSSLFYVDDRPAAFYFAERAGETIHVYANLALRDKFRFLSEFILIHLFQAAFEKGVKRANLGGSETKGLDTFKLKFKPVEQRQMHWLLYDPRIIRTAHSSI